MNDQILSREGDGWIYPDAKAFGGKIHGGAMFGGMMFGGEMWDGILKHGAIFKGERVTISPIAMSVGHEHLTITDAHISDGIQSWGHEEWSQLVRSPTGEFEDNNPLNRSGFTGGSKDRMIWSYGKEQESKQIFT